MHIDVWINCPDEETAQRIGRLCVEARLAACANVFSPVASIYLWKGAVETATERPLLLKSRRDLFGPLSTLVASLHPYETPGIIAVEMIGVNAAYAAWLDAELSPAEAMKAPVG
jgi:periplasmic divalent cation tolerance protein